MRRPRVPLSAQIALGMACGLLVGPALGVRAAALGEIGKLIIQLIKAVATPLVFLAIVNAVVKTDLKGRAGMRMLTFAACNATLALAVGLLLSNVLQPGRHLTMTSGAAAVGGVAYGDKRIDLLKTVSSYVPASLVQPFVDNVILSVVGLALLFGFALRAILKDTAPEQAEANRGAHGLAAALAAALRLMEIALGWVIRLIPFAVFGVVAKTVAESGFAPLRGLAAYVGVALLGMGLHVGLVYHAWMALYVRVSPRRFWRAAREPVVCAAGVNSSLATLPLTLRALDALGVPRASSTMGACVGTNFNNDGIVLYEGMAVLFVAQAYGIDLSWGQQLLAAGACLVAAAGVAGVPEAGFISLALVLNTVGLPVEGLPILLTVDWIVGRARSVTNVLSDMTLSLLVEGPPRRSLTDGST